MPNQPKKMNILKTKLLTVLFFAVGLTTYSQVGIGTTTPDASAALDITATDKGFLMPRLTTAQRMAIVGKAIGLQVYDTDLDAVMLHDGSDGTLWVVMLFLSGNLTQMVGVIPQMILSIIMAYYIKA
ncbi:MAG: hypothetical protein P8P55_06880 [Flavobacteriaceae bacterium]|nr:hypothetical protein [Flavobacteriaceae bacterium]